MAQTPGKRAGSGELFFVETLTPAQRRTLPARQAFGAKFSSPEEQSAYFAALARRSHERRRTLSGAQSVSLLALLERIVACPGEAGAEASHQGSPSPFSPQVPGESDPGPPDPIPAPSGLSLSVLYEEDVVGAAEALLAALRPDPPP